MGNVAAPIGNDRNLCSACCARNKNEKHRPRHTYAKHQFTPPRQTRYIYTRYIRIGIYIFFFFFSSCFVTLLTHERDRYWESFLMLLNRARSDRNTRAKHLRRSRPLRELNTTHTHTQLNITWDVELVEKKRFFV